MQEEQEQKKSIISFFNSIARASDVFAAEWPNNLKPLAKILFILFSSFMYIFLSPFMIISTPFRKLYKDKKDKAYNNLSKKLEEIWHEFSPTVAIEELNNVYDKLHNEIINEETKWKIDIEPYGRFTLPSNYITVANTLYLWGIRRDNWIKANEICDDVLKVVGVEYRKSPKGMEQFIVRKAKCIYHMKNKVAAEEYLLKYLDNENPNNEVNQYLYELRKT